MASTTDILRFALQSEEAGVPVDWKRLCILINDAAVAAVAAMANPKEEAESDVITDPQEIHEIMEADDNP